MEIRRVELETPDLVEAVPLCPRGFSITGLRLALPRLDVPALGARGFKVALDCVRGAGATIMPELLDALGCEVVATNTEMDGCFPCDPEPTAENPTTSPHSCAARGADVGLAVDPDVDR